MSITSLGRSLSLIALALGGLLLPGCATEMDEGYEDDFYAGGDEGDSDEDPEAVDSAVSIPGNWKAPASVITAGARARHGYQGASGRCAGSMKPGARALGNYVKSQFARNISSPGQGLPAVQGYNCRKVRGGNATSMHGMGRAIDVFVKPIGGKADNTKGDAIANWAVQNAAELGVQMVIWDRSVWSVKNKQLRGYGGSHAHHDHIHIEITTAAANKSLAWYRGR